MAKKKIKKATRTRVVVKPKRKKRRTAKEIYQDDSRKLGDEILDPIIEARPGPKPRKVDVKDYYKPKHMYSKSVRYTKRRKSYVDITVDGTEVQIPWSPNKKIMQKRIRKARMEVKMEQVEKKKRYVPRHTKSEYVVEKIKADKYIAGHEVFWLVYKTRAEKIRIMNKIMHDYGFKDFEVQASEIRFKSSDAFGEKLPT